MKFSVTKIGRMCAVGVLLSGIFGFFASEPAHADALGQLAKMRAETKAADAEQRQADQKRWNVQLEPWHCIGPFKDGLFESLWLSFNTPYPPEEAVLAAGRDDADMAVEYPVEQLPGMLGNDTVRRWTRHDGWVNGYRHLLPRGPAPSRSEIVYLTRSISVDEDVDLEMKFFAEDYVRVWLNGEQVGEAIRRFGPNRFPSAVVTNLPLKKGANRLLIKIGSLHSAHGFAFSLTALHPTHHLLPGQWDETIRTDGPTAKNGYFTPMNRPYKSDSSEKRVYRFYNEDRSNSEYISMIAKYSDLSTDQIIANMENVVNSDGLCQKVAFVSLQLDHALTRIHRYKGALEMIPMYDPPESQMYEMLEQNTQPSEGGAAYTAMRTELSNGIKRALANFDAGKLGSIEHVLMWAEQLNNRWDELIEDLPPIVFVKRPIYSVNAIGPYWGRGTTPSSICVFDPSQRTELVRTVFHDPDLAIYDMNLSWDAKSVLFSAHTGKSGRWQLYRVNLDGTGLTRLTHDDESDFISPCEIPDGRIVYVSTQANTWVQCQTKKAGLLYVCDADGTNPQKLSANIDSDHSPQVMDDGRIMFTRWDYGIEKNVFARHALWTMNPDGTDFRLFFGNTIEDPAGFWKARQVPGRPEVVCVFGPHHNNQAGMLGVVWNRLGREAPRGQGYRFITDEIPSYCDNNTMHGFQDPMPLNERLFLCSYGGDGGVKNRLYLLDDLGNRRCIYEAEDNLSCFYPIPVTVRKKPPVLVDRAQNPRWTYQDPEEMNLTNVDTSWGTMNVQNVYRGVEGYIELGEAKFIQVIEQVQKSRCMAGGEAWGHTPIIGRGTVHVRRVIGTVPIEEDGSANFEVPALRSISLNLLDEQGRTIMRMGSDMHVMPGENRSCIGCHEDRHQQVTPDRVDGISLAMRKSPVRPEPENWGTDGLLDYQQVVQPVWDRHCTECHSGAAPEAGVSMTGDRTRFFCVSYDNMIDRGLVDYANVFALDHDETTPKSVGAIVSPLLDYMTEEHCGHEIPWSDQYRVNAWIDANVPYYGTYDYTKVRGIGARDSWETNAGRDDTGWMIGHVADVFNDRCIECHARTVRNQALYGKSSFTVTSRHWPVRSLTSHGAPDRYPMSLKYGPEFRLNLTRPADSLMLNAPLAKSADGLGMCHNEDGSPVFADRNDKDYQRMLTAIEMGKHRLYSEPRIDMTPQHIEEITPTVLPLDQLESKLRIPSGLSDNLTQLAAVPGEWQSVLEGATATSPDDVPCQGGPPRVSVVAAIDGNPATYWDDEDNRPVYRYQVKLREQSSVVGLSIEGWRHHDFAPRSFNILCDGKEIGSAKSARYINNRLIVQMPKTECQTIELVITASYGGSPGITELDIFGE